MSTVKFEVRSEIDNNKTREEGRTVYVNTDYAIVSIAGSTLTVVEYRVTEKRLAQWTKEGKQTWVDAYRRWKESGEEVIDGTPLKEWPQITPAEIDMYRSINIITVEQLAEADENAMRRIGFGARNLKNKAQAWLMAASNTGVAAERIAQLEADNKALQGQLEDAMQKITKLADKLESKPRRGRPPKAEMTRDAA